MKIYQHRFINTYTCFCVHSWIFCANFLFNAQLLVNDTLFLSVIFAILLIQNEPQMSLKNMIIQLKYYIGLHVSSLIIKYEILLVTVQIYLDDTECASAIKNHSGHNLDCKWCFKISGNIRPNTELCLVMRENMIAVDYVVMRRNKWEKASVIFCYLFVCVFSHYLAAPWHHPHLPSRLQWLRGPSQAWSQTSPETTWLPEVSCDSVAAVLVLYPYSPFSSCRQRKREETLLNIVFSI